MVCCKKELVILALGLLYVFTLGEGKVIPNWNTSGFKFEECITAENVPGKCTSHQLCHQSSTSGSPVNTCNNERMICCSLNSTNFLKTYNVQPREIKKIGENKQQADLKEACGNANVSLNRAFGGSAASLGDWPWMTALGYQYLSNPADIFFKCGGSLISNKWVLTAAHCVLLNEDVQKLYRIKLVRLGDLDLDPKVEDGATSKDILIRKSIVHPNFKSDGLNHDIALIELEEEVKFTNGINPVCVLNIKPIYMDHYMLKKMPFVTGWGKTEYGPTTRLQMVRVPSVPLLKCQEEYRFTSANLSSNIICAGEEGKDTCQGDSGGPRMTIEKNKFHVIGIVSSGIGCGSTKPGLYTSVPNFIQWINNVTGLDF